MTFLEEIIHRNVTLLGDSILEAENCKTYATTNLEIHLLTHISKLNQLISADIDCMVELKTVLK